MTGWRAGVASAVLAIAIWQGLVWATELPRFIPARANAGW